MARDFDSVAECYTSDELRQLILSLEAPPAFAAAMMSSKTMSRAVSCESAPFMRTVRCRTVAKALSIGFDKRRCVPCSAEKSKNVNNASRSLSRQSTALSYLATYFSAKRRSSSRLRPQRGSRKARFRANPDAHWAESTSAACRGRSGSCARLSEGGYGDKRDGDLWRRSRLRQCKYLNNIVEQDHRRISLGPTWAWLRQFPDGAEDVGGF
jgi:hypothetical protein